MLRVIELFAGIGSQTQALKNLNIEHEVIAISEIDKYAIQSYESIHGPVNNLGDISKIISLPKADLWTYSFPCQDISNAGLGKGFSRDSGTRSGLLWEVERLLNCSARPEHLLMENVPMLLSERYKKDFARWVRALSELGYTSYYGILNSKDFDVPQDRNRVFMVSTLNGDVFTFPAGGKPTKTINDISEINPKEKYYIGIERSGGLLEELKCVSFETKKQTLECIGRLTMKGHDYLKRVYNPNGYCPAICAMGGGNQEPKIRDGGRIRKLTPLECWRLMGFSDGAFNLAKASGVSDSQLYRQAGNSIVVPVLEAIFTELYLKEKKNHRQTMLSEMN